MSTRMTEEERVFYGFCIDSDNTRRFFEALPILPEPATTNRKMANKLNLTIQQVSSIVQGMPFNAPVYQDDGEIGRIK